MINTTQAYGGMVVAPHQLAAQAGCDVLRAGGNAIEAMVAAAATIAVVYPHMNALGGDGFWLIHEPGRSPVAIDACGPAAALASADFYAGLNAIPTRGPKAALTVAGTIGGWSRALELSAQWGGNLPLGRLLGDAIRHASDGIAVSRSQARLTRTKLQELAEVPGFSETFLLEGAPPAVGQRLRQPALARTLTHLAAAGLDDFYRGDLGRRLGAQLQALGSPLRVGDLAAYRAQWVSPLELEVAGARVFNLPPPTQGLASLMILGIFERLRASGRLHAEGEGFAHVHGLVEATKSAFRVRDAVVTDPGRVPVDPSEFLVARNLAERAAGIDPERASPWPDVAGAGDTVWLGAIDAEGRAVSFIQSIFWEFGSGIVLDGTGIAWQNRGSSFSLRPDHLQYLEPGRKPFHTLNPALALFPDGRVMPYGTMGGEGQPQTQAAIFTRYAWFGQSLQESVTAPRWLLGRTWGDRTTTLKVENRMAPGLVSALRSAGHEIEVLDEGFSDTMGHAGALVRHPDGRIEGAADPRSDGMAAAF
jgi:gamma-glutamyltranspeptidase